MSGPTLGRSQAWADLQWLLATPSLLADPLVLATSTDGLDRVDVDALDARVVATGTDMRVGRYFERLVSFWLQSVLQVEMLGESVQVRDDKRTRGELDFVFDDKGVATHLETAVKFYLRVPEPNDLVSSYPGPNATDNFERKVTRLFDHQLPMSAGVFPQVRAHRVLVKGMIFDHPLDAAVSILPARLNPHCERGTWIRASELDLLDGLAAGRAAASITCGHIVTKPHWLAPALDPACDDLASLRATISRHFAARRHPLMVSLRSAAGAEVERVFVVGQHWPAA